MAWAIAAELLKSLGCPGWPQILRAEADDGPSAVTARTIRGRTLTPPQVCGT